ncbi:metallophosphoesterase family protein [Candidatus Nitronereus thalassa]|uniref:Metallophosphoesterase n=1 Tax=Candidatus Nitronereus thalassa TaxID=3020898 RepID=A0ABU3KBN7_9BACT|nr:metallophosphoesterase [Candidatus Nitronereus thalassa]MDT7043733.1 metallophosphoesterase [Candidatus Nitronereus thalassa]
MSLDTTFRHSEQKGGRAICPNSNVVNIAAVGDVHCPYVDPSYLKAMLQEIDAKADVLLLCGDLTHEGHPSEAAILAELLAPLRCPTIGVLGNHDYEMGEANIITQVLRQSGVIILDGGVHTACGIDFVGTKGFAGGFDDLALQPWGEPLIKEFVAMAKLEAEKLESSLKQSTNHHRVAILHYSPIRGTVEGEPEAIIPFLGSSYLENVLLRYPVEVVFHGHAHHGQPKGMTKNKIPVFNVALPLLQKAKRFQTPVAFYALTVNSPS